VNAPDIVDRARRYVALSNAGDLDAALAMFDADATYRSAHVGAFTGRSAIGAMMRDFFARFVRPHWAVSAYRTVAPDTVAFDFVMRGTAAATGASVERRGHERITFTGDGRIGHIEVT
jgi:hypothetical protein